LLNPKRQSITADRQRFLTKIDTNKKCNRQVLNVGRLNENFVKAHRKKLLMKISALSDNRIHYIYLKLMPINDILPTCVMQYILNILGSESTGRNVCRIWKKLSMKHLSLPAVSIGQMVRFHYGQFKYMTGVIVEIQDFIFKIHVHRESGRGNKENWNPKRIIIHVCKDHASLTPIMW